MIDFTLATYKLFLSSIIEANYNCMSFQQYLLSPLEKFVLLRHDIDKTPLNSLFFANIQAENKIQGSYYFRIVSHSYNEKIIRQIASLGHEIGYHYEDLAITNGNIAKAYDSFCRNLDKFRKIYPVKTICMHGSPYSKWDSKIIWQYFDYKKLGIIGEPYFDLDFNNMFYLTDTGRRWDGWRMSIRDKVPQQARWKKEGLYFHSTKNIINAVKRNKLPNNLMFTFHPQRWTNKILPWSRELLLQNTKNLIKTFYTIS